MPCPKNGPCPCESYTTPLDLCCLVTGTTFPDPCLVDGGMPVKQDIIDNAIQAAAEILWAATGRQFGVCAVKIRPCQSNKGCDPCGVFPYGQGGAFGDWGYGGFPWYPIHTASGWTNVRPCDCRDSCSCTKLCEIDLPYPVCQINEVKVDGIVLSPDQYRVDDFRRLVRLGGTNVTQTLVGAVGPIGGPISVGAGPITITGGAVQAVSNGILVPAGPGPYTFALSPGFTINRSGLGIEVIIPAGSFGSMDVFGIAGGEWVVEPAQGDIQVTKTGCCTVHWSPSQVAGNVTSSFRIRMIDPGNTNEFLIQNVTGNPAPIISTLFWTDPGAIGCWPDCQDLTKTDDEVGTWSVEVAYGRPVPALLKIAAAELACQFIKACAGQPCQLPQRISSISRQGVTVGFLDPMDFLAGGRTGIYIVDLAIKTFNPKGLLKQASVYSPDVGKKWTRVDTGATTTDQCRPPEGTPAPFFG